MKQGSPFLGVAKKDAASKLSLYFCLLLLLCPFAGQTQTSSESAFETAAEEPPQITNTPILEQPNPNKIADLANVLTTDERTKLSAQIEAFIKRHHMDLVLCTTDNTGGKSSMEFADDYFDYNGYGIGPDLSGILLLIDWDNRQVYISTAGRAIEEITDSEVEKILDVLGASVTDNPYRSFSAGIRAAEKALGAVGLPVFFLPEPKTLLLFLVIGLAAGAVSVIVVLVSYRAKQVKDNYPFNTNAQLDLTRQIDVFMGKNIIKQKIERSDSSGSGGSRHTSSSGRSHGGGGRSF